MARISCTLWALRVARMSGAMVMNSLRKSDGRFWFLPSAFWLFTIVLRSRLKRDDRSRQLTSYLGQPIAEAGPAYAGQLDPPAPPPVKSRMDGLLRFRRVRIKLHGVGLHAHDRAGMSGEERVRDLRQHRVGEILHHER